MPIEGGGRAAHVAKALETRQMLLPGTTADQLPHSEHENWEGLQDGSDDDFLEAAEAYIEVCSEAHCDIKYMKAWQRHSTAAFAEALMELVATYRTA
eukprot:2901470-Prymnesium_polylepis.1